MSGPLLEVQFNKVIRFINLTQNNEIKIKKPRLEIDQIQTASNKYSKNTLINLNEKFLLNRENSPTIEHFNQNYFLKNIPCIITNQMEHWPAIKKWR